MPYGNIFIVHIKLAVERSPTPKSVYPVVIRHPTDAARQLEKRLKGVFPSSKQERDAFMEILATAGILVPSKVRPGRGGKNDFFAIAEWRGEDGYSEQAVHEYFGPWL